MRYSLVRWLQNSQWSIRTKLMAGFLSVALFMLILTALSVGIIGELGQRISRVYEAQAQVIQATKLEVSVSDLKQALDNTNTVMAYVAARNADALNNLITVDEASNRTRLNLADYGRQRGLIQEARTRISDLVNDPLSQALLQNSSSEFFLMMRQDLQPMLDLLDDMRQNTQDRQIDRANEKWQVAETRLRANIGQVDAFLNQIDNAAAQALNGSTRAVQEASTARSLWQLFLLLAGLIAVIIALVFGLTLTLVFTRPVERLRSRLVRLAEGDLATRLDVANRDQLGELAGTFNQSMRRLGGVVEQVQNQALRVTSAAAEIASASSHSALVSVEQAGAVAEATVTIEQLSHTAQQIAEAAALVANAAEQALSSASDGQETVRESIVGINSLKNRVRTITDRILALSERSQRVGHIIAQVASIAEQTHLLALNAAIESAAAGENGKRFAVVAASVKQLAERSRQATKDVQTVLNEIQDATNASVMATEQGMKEAERGVTLAHRTGDANENIIQMVERTVQLASAISLATQQQRSASEQVVASMHQLATAIQDGAGSAKQSSSLATSLDQVALELRQASSQFKVQNTSLDNPDSSGDNPPQFEEITMSPASLRAEPAR